jgi:hypothetical protein
MRRILEPQLKYNPDGSIPVNLLPILMSLIEEVQVYGNRMESALGDNRDYQEMKKEYDRMKAELKASITDEDREENRRRLLRRLS